MTDLDPLNHLHDAFGELERQADAVGALRADRDRPVEAPHRMLPIALVAASVVLVLVVAGAVVLIGRDSNGTPRRGVVAGASPASPIPTSTASTSTVPTSSSPTTRPQPSATGSAVPSSTSADPGTSTTASTPTTPPAGPAVPTNAREMAAGLHRVLGAEASITVTERHGNYIVGVLTAAGGAQGGFDIQALSGKPGDTAFCEDADTSHCRIRSFRGGSLATGHEPTEGGGTVYLVDYVFPNGTNILMHLSNLGDPKGGGTSYGTEPPLSLNQVSKIVSSPRWSQ